IMCSFTLMNEKLKEKFPEWTNEIDNTYSLILTNDLDSLFTVAILRLLFGCDVGMFYDFHRLYSNREKFDKSKIIGCDLAVEDEETRTFCNHVTRMWKDDKVNPMSANLNNFATGVYGGGTIQNTTYFKKYNGSTALTVLAIYNAFDKLIQPNHTELTEEQKLILVSIDSYFWGAYHPKKYEAHKYFYIWQKALGLEMFNDIFNKYSKSEIMDFQRVNKLKGNIFAKWNNNTYELGTGLDIGYLQEQFPMLDFSLATFDRYCEFDNPTKEQFYTGDSKHDITGRVFSLAVINRNEVKITRFKD
ncbi:hypothetical protein ABEW77_21020, partial [Heyndrickxia sporothermodurans]